MTTAPPRTRKPAATPAAKPAATPAAKPAATPAAKPAATPAAKPAATPAARPVAKAAAKPAAQPAAKAAAQPAAKPAVRRPAKAPASTPAPTTAAPTTAAPRAPRRKAGPVEAPVEVPAAVVEAAVEAVVEALVEPEGAPYVTVVLPCFNEQDHVLLELERISAAMDASGYSYELVAYDDKSTDNTLAVLREAAERFPRMRVVPFPRNQGSGTIRRIGTRDARGTIVVWTDADMTYPNERIPEFVRMLDDDALIDQVVGARTTEEGTYKLLRVPAKWTIRQIAQILTGEKIPDLNSGLRAFRRDVSLPYLRLLPAGFSCVTTLTVSFLSNQHDIKYEPIEYAKRAGVSKFKFGKDAYRYILQVLRMVMYFNPIKVLMPLALTLLVIGGGKTVYDVIAHPVRIAINTLLLLVAGLLIASVALLADLVVRSRPDL